MFSESFSAPDSCLRYEIIVDGRRLDAADFGIYRWDMVQQPLAAFDRRIRKRPTLTFDRSRFNADLSRHLFAGFPVTLKMRRPSGHLSGLVPANYLTASCTSPSIPSRFAESWFSHTATVSILLKNPLDQPLMITDQQFYPGQEACC